MSIETAKTYLDLVLRSGPAPALEVIAGAKQLGISERTLKRAKSELEVQSVKQGHNWMWSRTEQEGHQEGQTAVQEGHDAPDDAKSRIAMRKKRVSEARRLLAFSLAEGGMVPHSQIRAAKGYTDDSESGG